jgi:hypothetical protein
VSEAQLVRVLLFEFNVYASKQRYSFATNQHDDQYEVLTAGASDISSLLPDIVGRIPILLQPCKAGLEPRSNQANVSIILILRLLILQVLMQITHRQPICGIVARGECST